MLNKRECFPIFLLALSVWQTVHSQIIFLFPKPNCQSIALIYICTYITTSFLRYYLPHPVSQNSFKMFSFSLFFFLTLLLHPASMTTQPDHDLEHANMNFAYPKIKRVCTTHVKATSEGSRNRSLIHYHKHNIILLMHGSSHAE